MTEWLRALDTVSKHRCPECGALVIRAEIPKHEGWHATIERRLTALERPGDHYRTFGR